MFRLTARRGLAAAGIAMGLVMTAGLQAGSAQPRPLPNLQNQQQDRVQGSGQYDRRDGREARDPEGRLDQRLAFLHERLRITPAQERQWGTLVNVLRDEVQDARDRRDFDARRGSPSVIDRLEQRERRLTMRKERMDRIVSVMRPLYASFSEEQKRTADRLMFQADGRGRGGFGRGRGPGFDRDRDGDRDGRDFDRPRFDDRRDRDYR